MLNTASSYDSHSIHSVHAGMKFDEKPFENTGQYLHKSAPKQYNETKIAKEKQNYIKKYIDVSGSNLDLPQLKINSVLS